MANDPSVSVGGVTYRVTPEYLANAATNCTKTANVVQTELSAIKSYVNSLEASWGGVAHNRFVALMTEYDIFARMLHDALTGIASGLHGNYVNYKESEQQNISNLSAIEASMPGGHGAAANLT
jgi:WXG100 family type VII secretion target